MYKAISTWPLNRCPGGCSDGLQGQNFMLLGSTSFRYWYSWIRPDEIILWAEAWQEICYAQCLCRLLAYASMCSAYAPMCKFMQPRNQQQVLPWVPVWGLCGAVMWCIVHQSKARLGACSFAKVVCGVSRLPSKKVCSHQFLFKLLAHPNFQSPHPSGSTQGLLDKANLAENRTNVWWAPPFPKKTAAVTAWRGWAV